MPFISPENPIKTKNNCYLAAICKDFTKKTDLHPHCRSCRTTKGLTQYSGCTPEGPRCNICIGWSKEAFVLSKRSHRSRKQTVAPTTPKGEGIKLVKVSKSKSSNLSSKSISNIILSSMSVNTSEADRALDSFIQTTITSNTTGLSFVTSESLTVVAGTARSTPPSSVPLPLGTVIPPHGGTGVERNPLMKVNPLLDDINRGLAPSAAISTVESSNTVANTGIPANTGVPTSTGTPSNTGTPATTGTPFNTGTPANAGKPTNTGDPGQYYEKYLAGESQDSDNGPPLLSPAYYAVYPHQTRVPQW